MKTAEQILEKNKCREQNILLYGAAHARLSALFINFSMYNLHSTIEYSSAHKYELSVFYHDEDELELIEAILDYYDLTGIEVKHVEVEDRNLYYFEFCITL